MIKMNIALLFISFATLTSCMGHKAAFKNEHIAASVTIKSFKITEEIGNQKTIFAYGNLRIEGAKNKIKFYNLSCVKLKIGKLESQGIYIDSIASFLTDNYRADSDGKIEAPVYWVFSHQENFSKKNLDSFNIALDVATIDNCRL